MNIPAQPIGQDPQSYILWIIAKELESLRKIVASSSGSGGPVTIVNGGNVVQGSTTDPRSAATDATAVTIMQVLKELSYLLQNKLGTTIADGDLSTLGTKADAKSSATDVTAITLMSVAKEISYLLQNILKNNPVDADGKPIFSPDKVDTISETIFYEGWTSLSLVRKTDISTYDIKIITWGSGTWANRATLIYS